MNNSCVTTESKKLVKPVCNQCGSDEVHVDARASWDIETQNWELVGFYDYSDCEQCQEETNLEMIEV